MSKAYECKDFSSSMRRTLLLISLATLFMLAACAPGGGSSASGNGVQTLIINPSEYSEAFFTLGGETSRPDSVASILPENSDLEDPTLLYTISTMVHNRGASESIAAMYVSGYDPNLFRVIPLQGYSFNQDIQSCQNRVGAQEGGYWNIQRVCKSVGDTLISYGIGNTGGKTLIDSARLSLYNFDASKYADKVASFIARKPVTVFSENGILTDLTGGCEWTNSGSASGGFNLGITGVQFAGKELRCNFRFGLPFWELGRSSRGALAVHMYASDMEGCGNGCVLVPYGGTPDSYIQGDTERYPGGQAYYVDYAVVLDRSKWPRNMNDHSQLFQFTTCSLYTTYATPTVCIDPTPGRSESEACAPGTVVPPRQAAPLQITKIEQRGEGGRTVFTIHVKDAGNGRVFRPGAVDACSPITPASTQRQAMDLAHVLDVRVLGSTERLDCGDELIRLYNGAGQISCTHTLDPAVIARGAYQTSLNIEIAYLYRTMSTVQSNIYRI